MITAYVLTIVMVAGFVWGLFTLLIDLIKGIWKEAKGYFILEGTGIVIDDETVDNLILAIEATGIDLEDLELLGDIDYKAEDMEAEIQEAKRKYIKMFYRAQVISQELKRGDDGLQGHVYLNPENQYASNLRYMRYDVTGEDDNAICFRDLIESNSPNAKNFYSVTPEGQLVVASVEETTMQTNVDTDGNLKDDNETKKTYKVEEIPIDYQSMISQYSTPMAFFLELGMVTRNPNFLEAVAKMVEENTDIQLTILNTVTTEVTTEEATYTEHILERRVFEDGTGKLHYRDVETEVTKTETTTKTVVTTVPTVKVTSVDTWICRQKITYTKQEGTPEEKETQLIKQESDEPKKLSSDKTKPQKVTWITREDIKVTGSIKVDTYDDGVPSDYEYRAGENPDKDPTYVSFVDLMDVKFRIPNSKEKRTAADYLTTDVEWFYTLLRQSPETQGMEQIMRYIMHKYDPDKFPEVELDFGIFDPNYFSNFVGGVYGNSVEEKVWYSLRNMGFSEYAVAGVMGNIYGESSFRPGAVEGGSGEGIGLCQWSYGRKQNLIKYAESKGKQWSDIDIQVQFLMAELTPGGGADGYASYNLLSNRGYTANDWKNAKDPSEAATVFCYIFERPGKPRLEVRKQAAERYYKQFSGKEMSYPAGSVNSNGYTFPHYLQRNYKRRYGASTIAQAGCGPTSLAMILAGLLKNPSITPVTVVENMEAYYPNYSAYYTSAGTIYSGMLNNNLLKKCYNVRATSVSTEQGIKAVESGKSAIGRVQGHILAIVPVPEQYKGQGYRFYIMDSARGLDGPYKSAAEVRAKRASGGEFSILYTIEPN